MPNSFGMDRTIQLLNILLPGIDFIPVAGKYVKASLELTVTICELAKKVSANKEKLIDLALYIARLLIAIAMECQKVGMASSGLNVGQLVELQRILEEIRDMAEAMTTKGIVDRTWDVGEDKAKIDGLRNKLDQTIGEFLVSASVRLLADANDNRARLEDLERAVEELKPELEQHMYLYAAEQGRLSALRPVLSARHDHETARPGCLHNTRKMLLADIFGWIEAENAGDQIYWLTGLGGTGKSTIAQTVSERLAASSPPKLAASFFFSRYQAERRNPATVVRTIAYHLSSLTPQLRSLISEALQENPDIPSRSIQDQTKYLLVEPLTKASDLPSPIVFVFDALDECEGNGTQVMASLVHALTYSLPKVSVKIFLTSRLEPEIQNMSEFVPHKLYKLHDIDTSVVRGDIRAYFIDGFARIRRHHRDPSLVNWPSEEEIGALVDRAAGLFIFAATVIKYVDVCESPAPLLRMLLSTNVTHDDHNRALDQLYLQVMTSAIDPNLNRERQSLQCARLRIVIAMIIIAQDPLSLRTLARLVDLSISETLSILGKINAVLLLPNDEHMESTGVIRLFHPSFPDFVANEMRCTDLRFLVDLGKYHAGAAKQCLDLMIAGLKRDICGIGNPSLLNSEIADLEARIREHVPPELAYACKYWLLHLRFGLADDGTLLESLATFCEEKIFEWIECCSLLDVLPGALSELRIFVSQITNTQVSNGTAALLRDTERLMMEFHTPISASALHVYYSTAPWLPRCALLERATGPDSDFPRLLSRREKKWDPTLQIIYGHSSTVTSLAISPDGLQLVSASMDCSVRIWDARTGAPMARLDGHTGWVNTVSFSPDGTRVASGSIDKTVRIWDTITLSLIAVFRGHSEAVRAVCFSPDATQLASGSDDKTVRVWDRYQKVNTIILEGHTDPVRGVIFTHSGLYVISCSDDRSIRVWNLQARELTKQLNGHRTFVNCAIITHDDLKIISGSKDRTIRIWDTDTGKHIFSLKGHNDDVNCVALTPDDSHILSGSDDKTIRIWHMQTRTCVSVLSSHTLGVSSLATPPNGPRLFSGSHDMSIRVWDLSSLNVEGRSLSLVRDASGKHEQLKARVGLSARNVRQTFTNIRERGAHLTKSLTSDSKTILSFDITPNGLHIVTGHENHSICLWDQSGVRLIRQLSDHSDKVNSVTFSSDSAWIVSGSDDMTVRVWETKTGKALAKMKEHTWGVRSVAISADKRTIASGSVDSTVALWHTDTWSLQRTLKGHTYSVCAVAFSNDHDHIASGSTDCTVRVWNAATGDSIAVLRARNPIYHVKFCHGDSQITAVDSLKILYAWDLRVDAFPKIDDAHPPILHVDKAGWLWGPITPGGPARRICWLPISRRPAGASSSDILGRFRASSTGIVLTVSKNNLITCLDVSYLVRMAI